MGVHLSAMKQPNAFEWDAGKSARNSVEHGIDFEHVKRFEFSAAVVAPDDRKDYGEVREVASGFIGDRLHILVFTMREAALRVISLRKANKREVKAYVENIEREL